MDAPNANGDTPLMFACGAGNVGTAAMLLKVGQAPLALGCAVNVHCSPGLCASKSNLKQACIQACAAVSKGAWSLCSALTTAGSSKTAPLDKQLFHPPSCAFPSF